MSMLPKNYLGNKQFLSLVQALNNDKLSTPVNLIEYVVLIQLFNYISYFYIIILK